MCAHVTNGVEHVILYFSKTPERRRRSRAASNGTVTGPEKYIRQLTKWSSEQQQHLQQQQQQQDRRLVVDMYILKRLSPAKIQIQICLKLQSSKAAASSEQHRELAIDLGANLVLNCDRCHDAGVCHAKPRSLPVPIGPGAGHRLDTHTHTNTEGQTVSRSVRLAGDRRLAIADQPVSCGTRTWPTAQLTRDRGPGPASCLSHSPCSVPALPCPALCRSLLAPNFIVSKACYML